VSISLEGRVAVVTGAGRGIGRATAMQLARLGATVVVNDLDSEHQEGSEERLVAEITADGINSEGGRAVAVTADVADFVGAQAIIDAAIHGFGRVDILVNNAGLFETAPVWELAADTFGRVVGSHLLGAFNCTRHAAPHMKAQGWGRIVNLVSRAGLVGSAGAAAYGAAKGGIFGLTNACARDLAPFGVTVNGVNPASTDTRMVRGAVERSLSGGSEQSTTARNLLAALQPPENVAAAIAALCAEGAADINGEIVLVTRDSIGFFEPMHVERSAPTEIGWTPDAIHDALGTLERHPLATLY
jgi:3-oxoacyl-[acyl-carrier protein] reductase